MADEISFSSGILSIIETSRNAFKGKGIARTNSKVEGKSILRFVCY